jgi:hypothetical protein
MNVQVRRRGVQRRSALLLATARSLPRHTLAGGLGASLVPLIAGSAESSPTTQIKLVRIGALLVAGTVGASLQDPADRTVDVVPTSPLARAIYRTVPAVVLGGVVWSVVLAVAAAQAGFPVSSLSIEVAAFTALAISCAVVGNLVAGPHLASHLVLPATAVITGIGGLLYDPLLGSDRLSHDWAVAHRVYAASIPAFLLIWTTAAAQRELCWRIRR